MFGTSEVVTAPTTAQDVGAFVSAPAGIRVRVVIRNIGATVLMIGLSPQAVIDGSAAGGYTLPSGQRDVFELAPRQALYATSGGAPGRLSYAVSQLCVRTAD